MTTEQDYLQVTSDLRKVQLELERVKTEEVQRAEREGREEVRRVREGLEEQLEEVKREREERVREIRREGEEKLVRVRKQGEERERVHHRELREAVDRAETVEEELQNERTEMQERVREMTLSKQYFERQSEELKMKVKNAV